MNNVNLLGRLTRDPELRYTDNQIAVCRFSIAIDRGKDKNGNDRGADFPSCIAFNKTAENINKFFAKGRRIAVTGRLQTGSYEKDGQKLYTTDVIVDRFDFCDSPTTEGQANATPGTQANNFTQPQQNVQQSFADIPAGFEAIDDSDIPF